MRLRCDHKLKLKISSILKCNAWKWSKAHHRLWKRNLTYGNVPQKTFLNIHDTHWVEREAELNQKNSCNDNIQSISSKTSFALRNGVQESRASGIHALILKPQTINFTLSVRSLLHGVLRYSLTAYNNNICYHVNYFVIILCYYFFCLTTIFLKFWAKVN